MSGQKIGPVCKNFFILGMGRSGTTLLSAMLNAHPEVLVPPESSFLIQTAPWLSNSPLNVKALISHLKSDRGLNLKWEVDFNLLETQLEKETHSDTSSRANTIYKSYLGANQDWDSISCFGDKTPVNTFYSERISALIPEAKFVYIERDPRAVVASQKIAFGQKNVGLSALQWGYYREAAALLQLRSPSRIHCITFEDLIKDREAVILGVLGFLGLEFNEDVLKYYNSEISAQKLGDRISNPNHSLIRQHPRKDRIEAWKTELSKQEISEVNQVLSHIGTHQYSISETVLAKIPISTKIQFRFWKYLIHLIGHVPSWMLIVFNMVIMKIIRIRKRRKGNHA